jgi:hypothetical protein
MGEGSLFRFCPQRLLWAAWRPIMKSTLANALVALTVSLCVVGAAEARTIVQVDIYGTVIFNGITPPPLGTVTAGQTAIMSFQVDSNVFVDSIPGDVRAYDIIQPSFLLSFSGGASVGLAGGPSYFGVRDGDPVSDGFFVSTSTTNLGGVPLTQAPFQADYHTSYVGGTLSSVDILDALGMYDFTGLTVFAYNLWASFPDNVAMEIEYSHMTISAIPAPAALAAFAPLLLGTRRRRGV